MTKVWPKFRPGDVVKVAHQVPLMSEELMGFTGTVEEVENPGGDQWNYTVDGRYLNEQMLEMVKPDLPVGWPYQARFRYERQGRVIGFLQRNMTNHELRDIMVGLWLSMDIMDRADHIKALQHYMHESSRPGDISRQIGTEIRRGGHAEYGVESD